jgi:predicted nucleic acid-binding protein
MGLILDSSVLIAAEKGQLNLVLLLQTETANQPVAIAAITASELLHGCERAREGKRKVHRRLFVEEVLDTIPTLPFDLDIAREHARLWARLASTGKLIGAHDLLIAAACLHLEYALATVNIQEFRRVTGLKLIDIEPYKTDGR